MLAYIPYMDPMGNIITLFSPLAWTKNAPPTVRIGAEGRTKRVKTFASPYLGYRITIRRVLRSYTVYIPALIEIHEDYITELFHMFVNHLLAPAGPKKWLSWSHVETDHDAGWPITGWWFQSLWPSWGYYSQYMENYKIHVPNHQSGNRLHLLSPLVVSVFGDHGSTPSHDMAKSRAVTSLCSPRDTRPQLNLFSMGSSSLKFPRHAVSCFVVSCLKFRSLNTFLSVIN